MSKLLEEAIADAKAVRATALANAKASLVEAFQGQAEAMLAAKLKEEAGLDDMPVTDLGRGGRGGLPSTDLDGDDLGGELPPTDLGRGDLGNGFGDESPDVVSDAELDEILAELSGELDEEGEQPVPAPDMTGTVPPVPAAPNPWDMPPTPAPTPDATQLPPPTPAPAPVGSAPAPTPAPAPTKEDMEEINLSELLNSLNEDIGEEEDLDEELVDSDDKEECNECDEDDEDCVPKEQFESVQSELNEAIKVVKYLKGQINEINLLNAKLLYTNKLFKQYGLTNEQKMKIVETFDLTQNVREVKIAYTSLAESFNFGKSIVKKTNTIAKTITEGLASKPVASTKPTLIVENTNKQALRFQTLAGIREA